MKLLVLLLVNILFFIAACESNELPSNSNFIQNSPENFNSFAPPKVDNLPVKQSPKNVSYDNLMRSIERYIGNRVYFRGEVVQVSETIEGYVLRVSVTYTGLYWEDTIWVNYRGHRILEGDIIDLQGEVIGLKTYTAVLGNDITIPEISADFVEVITKAGDRRTTEGNSEVTELNENREVLVKSIKNGITLELNSISFQDKGDWGKIKNIEITIVNEMNDALWPNIQVFVQDKESPNSQDISIPKWEIQDGWLDNGQFLNKVYPIDSSVSKSNNIKIIRIDLVGDTYPRRVINSIEFETDLHQWI